MHRLLRCYQCYSHALSSTMLPVRRAILPMTVLSPVPTTTPVQVPICGNHQHKKVDFLIAIPSTILQEKKSRFFVSRGFVLVHSLERGWASDSPVKELLSTCKTANYYYQPANSKDIAKQHNSACSHMLSHLLD